MRRLNKKYWPYFFKMIPTMNVGDLERWCYDNLKSANWRNHGFHFYFKRESDASLFLLKWGHE